MEILLNGKRSEIEFEPDATIGAVVDRLSTWLLKQSCVIVSVRLDGVAIRFAEDEEIRSRAAAGYTRIEVEAQNARLLVRETVDELGQYLDRVSRIAGSMPAGESIAGESLDQLVEGLSWCEDVLGRVEEILRISYREIEFEGERFSKLVLKLGDLRDHLREAAQSGNAAALDALLRDSLPHLANALICGLPLVLEKGQIDAESDGPGDELAELLPRVQELPEQLEAIAVKISVGDTARGMEEFAAAIGTLERAFQLLDRCRKETTVTAEEMAIEGKSFDERNQDLMGILNELIQAFERKDRVLIGDLIEYEISPITEGLAKLIEKMQNSLKGSCH